jgi:hypothetical protein
MAQLQQQMPTGEAATSSYQVPVQVPSLLVMAAALQQPNCQGRYLLTLG